MYFVDVTGPGGAQSAAFPTADFTIGSGLGVEIRLDDAAVAEVHVTVSERDGVPFVSGHAPTLVDGVPLASPTRLDSRSTLGVGPYTVRFRAVDLTPETERMPPRDFVPDDEDPATPVAKPRVLHDASDDPMETAFLRALREDGEIDATRVVYADWLEENGHDVRACYLRAVGTVLDPASEDAGYPRVLGTRISDRWRGAVAPPSLPVERCPDAGCAMTWGALAPTGSGDSRKCGTCDERVHYLSRFERDTLVALRGRRVVVDPLLARSADDLEPAEERWDNIVIGRRPEGLAPADACVLRGSAARYFAGCAALEAVAVPAFERLARDLSALGAPHALVRRALEAACDETRHARTMARLAAPWPVRWRAVSPSEGRRSAIAIARENAIEGCVREGYGALVSAFQAAHASSAEVRRELGPVAEEEARHAALSWDVARWIEGRLPRAAAWEIDATRGAAIAELRREIDLDPSPEIVARAGYPTREEALALLDEVARSVSLHRQHAEAIPEAVS